MGVFDQMNDQFDQNDAENSVFFKLEDKQTVLAAFLGEPFMRAVYWVDGQGYQPWTEGCGKGKTILTSMNVALIAMVDGKPTVSGLQLCEQSKTFFRSVSKLDKKYGISSKLFEITRDGVKKETTYDILPDIDIDASLRMELDALTLFDLEASSKSESPVRVGESGTPKDASSGPSAVIDSKTADVLIEDLKTLKAYKPEILDDFLSEFSISKIRQLSASFAQSARSWVDTELEAMRHSRIDGESKANGGKPDPFAE
jgi:hypothetical protein